MFEKLTTVLVLCLSTQILNINAEPECGDQSLYHPCKCVHQFHMGGGLERLISCDGEQVNDIAPVFDRLSKNLDESQKRFPSFLLNNTFVTELKDNTFKDITFSATLWIQFNKKLTKIHPHALDGTNAVTFQVIINDNPALTSPDNSIYKVLSNMTGANAITLTNNNITEIPDNAFQPQPGFKLEWINVQGHSFKKIGSHAFARVPTLDTILLETTYIKHFPENVFAFDNPSDKPLTIQFINNFTNHVFDGTSLLEAKRPVTIFIWDLPEAYFSERVFLPFFSENKKNNIASIGNIQINCNDCRNSWMKINPDIVRWQYNLAPKCTSGKSIDDHDNFNKC